jgi:ABC-type thiamine transport system substrate-binding protein
MTPKEKAVELFNKFGCDASNKVDGMLKNMSFTFGFIGYTSFVYWKEVQKEIEKL